MMDRMRIRIGRGTLAVCLAGVLCAEASTRRERAMEAAMTSGQAAMEDGLYDIAEGYFTTFIRRASDDFHEAEGVLWLVQALYHQGRYQDVMDRIDDHLGRVRGTPLEGPYVFWKARAQFDLDQPERTIEILNTIDPDQLEPGYAVPVLRLGAHAHWHAGQTNRALEAFEFFDDRYPGHEEAAENLLDWAEILLEVERELDARVRLRSLEHRFPESESAQGARLLLGHLYLAADRGDEAREMLEALIDREALPSDRAAEAWYALARLYEREENLESAIEAVRAGEQAARRQDRRNQGRYFRARLLIREEDPDAALDLLRAIIRDVPGAPVSAEAQLEIGRIHLDRDEYEQAAKAFQHYLDAFEDRDGRAQALLGRGWSLLGLEQYGEAAASFDKAYTLHPEDTEKQQALFKVGDAYFENNQFRRARDEYLRLTTVFPGSTLAPRALYQAAECLARLRRVEEAVQEFRAIEDAFPASLYAEASALRIGLLKEELGEWGRAVSAYERVMDGYPGDEVFRQALHRRGLIRYRSGLFVEALEDFERIVEKAFGDDVTEQAFYMRGWCLYLLGRSEEAFRVCREFIERFPRSRWTADVLFWLAEYHYNRGDYVKAEERFLELIEQHPETPMAVEALYRAGRASMEAQEYLRAIEYFNRLARQYPQSPRMAEVRFAQGDALSHLGEFAGAILAFEEIIRKHPDSYLVNQAYGRRGDCQFMLGSEDPDRYEEALASYRAVMESPTASVGLQLQAEFKIGRTREKQGDAREALDRYVNVIYTYLDDRSVRSPDCTVWFTRAAFAAASIKETEGQWREAVHILERVVQADVPAGPDAARRIRNIEMEHGRI